ncbi:Geminivirus BL1 movement protein [Dioscorea alata]|uniref:Geminivirus BL1 movement protein n=1 Tax=Dioscorea alata TaxID=55571 RepID=A0ACB7WPT5_DIOAL|nr:Geminivirus BL1 movement protein [Dioscorea alata]
MIRYLGGLIFGFWVEESNIKVGTYFTKMKGLLKLSAAGKSNYVAFRGPTVKIHTPKYTLQNVDFRHVSYGPVCQAICHSNSDLSTYNHVRLLPGESYKDIAFSLCEPLGDNESKAMKDVDTIGPSMSEVGSSTSCGPRTSISMELAQLGVLIGKSISEALNKLQDSSPVIPPRKPI